MRGVPDPESVVFPRRKERKEDLRKETDHRKLRDEFFDHPTLLAISRLVSQGQFEAVDYPIATGKEGGVFRATTGGGFRAVKVYRIGNAVFRRLPAYALEELRREASERNYGRLIAAWTRREHTILRKMTEAGVWVPQPYGYLRNVLVMDFIGTDGIAAPRLQDTKVDDLDGLYNDLISQLRAMSQRAHLVHGDLSPYNVLYHEGRPVIIDVAQAIDAAHPQAPALFERDVSNFARYLHKLGLDVTPETMLAAAGGVPEVPG